jgi:HD-like signal output (HDOD) protein
MTAQVLKLANSARYGLSGRVRDVTFAVTVVGFSAVQSMAASFAAGAAEADVPDGFWDRAAVSATAGSLVAPRIGAPRPDGFNAGLLHELGDFLLLRRDAAAHARVHGDARAWDCRARAQAERDAFGTDHGAVLAEALGAWLLPAELVAAHAAHCDADGGGAALARALVGGQAVAGLATLADDDLERAADLRARLAGPLAVAGIDGGLAWALSRQAHQEAAVLGRCLAVAA